MANRLKRNLALSGISSRCYTVDDVEMIEQFKQTTKYKKWKDSKETKRKKVFKKCHNYNKALEEAYEGYVPSYMKLKVIDKPRLRL